MAENYLLITEITTGEVHEIPLAEIRKGIVTLGRKKSSSNHYQIGNGSEAQGWISSCHCSLFAEPRKDIPGQWDYYIKDGCKGDGEWVPSSNGIWVGGNRIFSDSKLQIRPGAGHVTIFPKIHDFKYECILEWPSEKPASPNDSHPTLQQQYESALMEKRVAEDQAAHTRQQLERLGLTMATMQERYKQESEELTTQLREQSGLLFELSEALERERKGNEMTKMEIAREQTVNRSQDAKIDKIRIFGIVAIAAISLSWGLDIEQLDTILQIVATLSLGGVAWASSEKPKA